MKNVNNQGGKGGGSDNAWDASIRGINEFAEKWVRRMPLFRSVRDAFTGGPGEDFIDWDQSESIAGIVALSNGSSSPIADAETHRFFEEMSRHSEELVEGFTGLALKEPLQAPYVLDRPAWVHANLESFKLIFEPFSRSYSSALKKMEGRRKRSGRLSKQFTRGILTVQIGLVMGYLSRNVLGQFDLGLPKQEDAGKLYIVYPNMLQTEGRMHVASTRDFRLWITLHEVTHAFEFAAFPWTRAFMRRMMDEYFSSVTVRLDGMGTGKSPGFSPSDLKDTAKLNELINKGGLISVMHNPEQREILGRIQAFMSLVEGYSNFVMDGVGQDILPTYQEMKEAFAKRRESKTGAERFIEKVLGFDLKLQQYQIGELFCREVFDKEGVEFLNLAWKREENLPTYEEIHHPFLWIERMRDAEGRQVEHFEI